ncbi:hypothetical protein V8E36_000583 [Tilletia maclaganii]
MAHYLFNISTFAPAKSYKSSTGKGMYGWNFIWRGKAYSAYRPLMIVLGSSVSRCDDISDVSCVINKALGGGLPGRILGYGGYSQAMLTDAGFGVLTIISPTCYNTSRLTPIGVSCSNLNAMHALRHYRPELITDILSTVSGRFGAVPHAWIEGNYGETCWSLNVPNFNSTVNCTQPVETTMEQASKLATTPVAIYASSNDVLANLSTLVRPSCDGINAASSAAGKGNMCTLRVQTSPYGSTSRVSGAPNHNQLCDYNMDPADINYVIKGYGGKSVTVSKSGNITDTTATTTTAPPRTTTLTTTTSTSTSTSIVTAADTSSSTSTTSTTTPAASTDSTTPTPSSTSTSTDASATPTSPTPSSSSTDLPAPAPTSSSSSASDSTTSTPVPTSTSSTLSLSTITTTTVSGTETLTLTLTITPSATDSSSSDTTTTTTSSLSPTALATSMSPTEAAPPLPSAV